VVLKASLSVFFPVFNGQAAVQSQIAELLEVLPELTSNFELVVIDDGSTDATCEVVHELSTPFPQVHSVVHPARWGQPAAMRTGLLHSSGDIILMRSEACEVGSSCLPKLWKSLSGHDAVLARAAGLRTANGRGRAAEPSWSLIRRPLLDAWRREADDNHWLDFIHTRARVCELEFAARPTAPRWPSLATHSGAKGQRYAAASAASATKRPNYLGRLKSFALGE
jgi:GT2 family glycosyltransferase